MALEHTFSATTKEGTPCHVELDVIENDDNGPCVVANIFYLMDKKDPLSYDTNCEDESYTITEKDCDIEDLDAVEKVVRQILSSNII